MLGEFTGDPRGVALARGWGWISDAWPMFKTQPMAWIGVFILLFLVYFVFELVPVLGPLVSTFTGPIFTAGIMIGAHSQYNGRPLKVEHLFAGFLNRPGRLALLGLVYLLTFVALMLITGLLMGLVFVAAGGGVSPEGLDPSSLDLQGGQESLALLLLPVLLFLALGVPLMMAILFAPALVALNDVPVIQAFKLSFLGCWRNILPFTVYGLAGFVLLILGALPLMAGLLVVAPLLTIAIYIAYRDIYYL